MHRPRRSTAALMGFTWLVCGWAVASAGQTFGAPKPAKTTATTTSSGTTKPTTSRSTTQLLKTVDRDNPVATIGSFLEQMNEYKEALEKEELREATDALDQAAKCLDQGKLPKDDPKQHAREAARFLKEVLDRLLVFEKEQDELRKSWQEHKAAASQPDAPVRPYKVKDTGVALHPVKRGEVVTWLFAPETVAEAEELYDSVKARPLLSGNVGAGLAVDAKDATQTALPGQEAQQKLKGVDTDNPVETLQSFHKQMCDHTKKRLAGDHTGATYHLTLATRCLHPAALEGLPAADQAKFASDAAKLIKEVLDRMVDVEDYIERRKNEAQDAATKKPPEPWDVQGTRIVLVHHTSSEGSRWVFSPETVRDADVLYQRVKDLPLLLDPSEGGGAEYQAAKEGIPAWARKSLFHVELWQWAILVLLVPVGILMGWVALGIGRALQRISQDTRTDVDDLIVKALARPLGYLTATGLWYVAVGYLELHSDARYVLYFIVRLAFFAAFTNVAYRLTGVLGELAIARVRASEQDVSSQVERLTIGTAKVVVLIVCVLLAADNLGMDVVSLVAGLGIGGLAVALAAKDTLANFFGSIMIMVYKPFHEGDWIVVDKTEGTVEEIGFRATSIRTFYNSIVTIPNSDIVMTHVDNMGRRRYRRVVETIGITYDTPAEKIEAFLEGVKNIIQANPYTRKDYFHVVFKGFGDSSLNIMLYFFLECGDWATELVEKQHVFLEVVRLADSLGVGFAFPTQTLHVETLPGQEPIRMDHTVDRDRFAAIARKYGNGGEESRPAGLGLFTPPHRETLTTRGADSYDDGE